MSRPLSQVEKDRRAVAAWAVAHAPRPGDILVRQAAAGDAPIFFIFVEARATGRHPGIVGRLCFEDGTPDERIARELGDEPRDTFIYPEHIVEVRRRGAGAA